MVRDCEPVKPLWAPGKSTVAWGAACVGFSAVALWSIGLSEHMPADINYWLGESALILGLAFSGLWASFSLSIPGSEINRPWRVPAAFLGAWILYLALGFAYNFHSHGAHAVGQVEGSECAVILGSLLVFPAMAVIALMSRGMTSVRKWAGFAVIAASAGFATLAVEFHCPTHTIVHHIVYHLAPAGLCAACGYFLANKFCAVVSLSENKKA